ncbi:MAG: N-acetylmuramoyl-L-alanine amidase [Crocinitomicaceae bacterium]|nr:N-acetylmuramoyl-L-alanine amidase [Crocinitomicaceae bacterium]
MSKRIYIIDPGHGGINPATGLYVTAGKRSPKWSDGSVYYEGVGNRTIASKVGEKLKMLGISFVYTVTPSEWEDIGLTTRVNRAATAVKLAKKPGVLISIHSNAAAQESAHGFEVFTTPGQTESDPMATILFNEFKALFPELSGRSNLQDGDPDKEELFTVISSKSFPSMLIETMFHTNQKECKMLMDPIVQNRIAQAIVNAIQKIDKL